AQREVVPPATSCAIPQNHLYPRKINAAFLPHYCFPEGATPEICSQALAHGISAPAGPGRCSGNIRPEGKGAANFRSSSPALQLRRPANFEQGSPLGGRKDFPVRNLPATATEAQ